MNCIRFIHISDSHLGIPNDSTRFGVNTLATTTAAVDEILALPFEPDFIVHTGDIVLDPDHERFKTAKAVFSKLTQPVFYVAGNHDDPDMIRAHLGLNRFCQQIGDTANLCYRFEFGSQQFLVLDGRSEALRTTGEDESGQGFLNDAQLEILQTELKCSTTPLTIFIHYAPMPVDSPWLDDNAYMLLTNGEEFHKLLVPYRDRLRGVFFGHVHRGMQIYRDGILYSGVAALSCQFFCWPNLEHYEIEKDTGSFFNIVSLYPDRTIVKEHVVTTHLRK